MITFICYSKCTTCRRAMEWLENKEIPFEIRDIKENNPTASELARWHSMSGLPLKRFFNTSGLLYKSMELKDKLPAMSEMEQIDLLSRDGMLVKRPLLVGDGFVLVGFREQEWNDRLK